MSRILQIQSIFPLFVHLYCFEIKSPISKIMCIQSLIIAIKSKRCHLLKIKFIWSYTQHTIFNKCRPINVLYFANNNWPIVRLKSFLWVLWVSNLISDFGVWNLTVHDEVIICGFQTIKVSSKDPRFSWKFISSFSLHFISMHNNLQLTSRNYNPYGKTLNNFESAIYQLKLLAWSRRTFKSM